MYQYIDDPTQYLQQMQSHKKVLVVKQEVMGFSLFDISLHRKGPMEDKLYLKNPFFITNIRRGNSLLQDNQSLTFCRRGMRKFYDLERKYIEREQGQPIKLSSYHEKACQNILHPIKQAFEEKKIIHLYKLFKENGEHCQISYTHEHWLVASKNCTILFNKPEDLLIYKDLRHTWAKIIATQWMEIIKEQNLDELKEFLTQHTLIGEYCGHPDYQHITRYPERLLVFYAIVKNNSPEICLPVEKAKSICQLFNLKFVKVHQVTLNSYECVLKQLAYWAKQIGEGAMEIEGEGWVAYAVTEDQNGTQQTISICKLKSVEYLIYRKLREMLKILIQKLNLNEKLELSVQLGKFLNEMQIIIKHYQPPQPIRYYLHIAKLAFEEVQKNKIPFEQIRYKFVDFLEQIQNMQEDKMNEIDELGEVKQNGFKRHVRIIMVTLPFFLEDEQLQNLKDKLNIQSIECQYMSRNQKVFAQRALSILHMIPKLPYNINNEQQLEEYLQNSQLQNQEPSNIVFVFLGLNQQALEKVTANLLSKQFQDQNPIISSFGVQFATAKPKVQQISLERWHEKAQIYLKECQKNFPNRTFVLDNLDYSQLDTIIKQFEQTEQPVVNEFDDQDSEEDEEKTAQKRIVIIYPLMIPGSGKSTLAQYIKQHYKDFPFYDICADEITLQLIKNQLGESQDSLGQKFQKVFPLIKETFQQEFHKKINEIINSQDKAVLFVDRNCIPHTLLPMIDHVKAIQTDLALKKGVSIQIFNLGLIFPTQESNITNTPFNFDYAITILNRLLTREDHILLGNDVIYKTQVCMKNLALFTGFKAKDSYYKKLHLHKIVPITYPQDRFSLEKQDLQLAQDLVAKCVLTSQQTWDLGQGEEFTKLIDHMYMIKEKYKIPEFNLLEECQQNCNRLSAVIKKLLSS